MNKIDVLAVMWGDAADAAQYRSHFLPESKPKELLKRSDEARAAVAEVIEAGRAYVYARATYNDAVNSRGLVGQRDARLAMEAAKKRHIAILERIGETK